MGERHGTGAWTDRDERAWGRERESRVSDPIPVGRLLRRSVLILARVAGRVRPRAVNPSDRPRTGLRPSPR
ncbi:hypothetical protein ACN20G_03015 [Streptomyces sp. BI20]|uniref:hypothetical protein n=1 Tax=Streptomyces sp. BI20 TaxID=3403460 RepID=UPI003C77781F